MIKYNYHFTLKTIGNEIIMDQDRLDSWFEDFLADRLESSFNEIYFSKGIASIERKDLRTGETVTVSTPKELTDLFKRTIEELESRKRELNESIDLLEEFTENLA